jgi:hypothetical protein
MEQSSIWEEQDKTGWEPNDPRWFSPADRVLFLHSLSTTGGSVATALASIQGRVSPIQALRAYKADPEFRSAWDEAVEASTMLLESDMVERGRGWTEPIVTAKGELVGEKRVHSDKLLEIALKSRRPGVYRDNVKVEASGPNGQPLDSNSTVDKIIGLIERIQSK